MAVILMTNSKEFMGLSTDEKPTGEKIYPGSTFHEYNTGETFIFDGTNWVQDLRLIYAVSVGIRP